MLPSVPPDSCRYLKPGNVRVHREEPASYLYQVHLYHWLESNGHGRYLVCSTQSEVVRKRLLYPKQYGGSVQPQRKLCEFPCEFHVCRWKRGSEWRRRMYLTDILRRLSVSRNTTCGITIETAGAHIVCVRFRCCSAVQCGTLGQPFAASTCRSSVPAPVLFCSRIPPPRGPCRVYGRK